MPAGVGAHRPIDEGRAQLRQAPPQAPSQQTPSTQKSLTHSVAAAQRLSVAAWGRSFRSAQTCPATQSASLAQRAMHAPSLQR